MNIRLFELFKEFFDLIYSPFIEEISEEEIFNDEEKGWQELLDNE